MLAIVQRMFTILSNCLANYLRIVVVIDRKRTRKKRSEEKKKRIENHSIEFNSLFSFIFLGSLPSTGQFLLIPFIQFDWVFFWWRWWRPFLIVSYFNCHFIPFVLLNRADSIENSIFIYTFIQTSYSNTKYNKIMLFLAWISNVSFNLVHYSAKKKKKKKDKKPKFKSTIHFQVRPKIFFFFHVWKKKKNCWRCLIQSQAFCGS